jgi:hypothetical protein
MKHFYSINKGGHILYIHEEEDRELKEGEIKRDSMFIKPCIIDGIISEGSNDQLELEQLENARTQKIQEVKTLAGSILSKTDYLAIRQYEGSKDMPNYVKLKRNEIRYNSNIIEKEISILKTIEEINNYPIEL